MTDRPDSWFVNRGLFSDHFLRARLPEWNEWKVDVELAPFRESLQSLYSSKKSILPHLNEAQTELELVQPVLDLLGYADSFIVQAPTRVGQRTNRPDYALFPDVKTKNKAYEKLDQNDYALCIGIADAKYWERELDLTKANDRDTFTNQNPSFQIFGYLSNTRQNWGILTNGRLWRLYSSKSHSPLGNYYEIDLVQLLEAPAEMLKYFYLFFRKRAFLQVEGKSLLDRIFEGSEEYAVELEADIKERAYDVVERLCRGFAVGFAHERLADAALKSIYDNSLTLLYRLLFVFYAEARELLPLTTNASYRENYSLRKLTHEIDEILQKGYELSTSSAHYYHNISSLFHSINNGDRRLGIAKYNGGLFDPAEHPFLEKQAIPDAHLVQAIHQLARIADKKLKREVAVDYNTLSERHLGSIYEGLLEFRPRIAPHDLVTTKDKGSVKYAPADKHPGKKVACRKDELYLANDKGERKSSGSYYTPEYIVNYIVENTLDPLVQEAHEKVKALRPEVNEVVEKWQGLKEEKRGLEPTEKYERRIAEENERLLEPYLSLKVLDPAMGSGHFLARATDFLAEAMATDPDIKSPLDLAEQSELTYYRRRIVESCIYGVDLNPLAVELAKLTLWLTTMAKSKPLSFLNHHLRVGNSLIGARVGDLDEIPRTRKKRPKLGRAPVQIGLFQSVFNQKLYDLLHNRALIARLPTETLENVHEKQRWEKEFSHNVERFRVLADVWVSTFFGNNARWDEYNSLVENLQIPDPEWEKLAGKAYVQNALNAKEDRHFFHWELEFPEVFFDQNGQRLTRPGFDAVVGNPPYGKESIRPIRGYINETYDEIMGESDAYPTFMAKVHELARSGGRLSLIVPDTWLTLYNTTRIRKLYLTRSKLETVVRLNETVFTDPMVDPMIFVAEKSETVLGETEVSLLPKATRLEPYFRSRLAVTEKVNQSTWLGSTRHTINLGAAIPEVDILLKMRDSPKFHEVLDFRAGCKPYEVGKGTPPQTKRTIEDTAYTSFRKESPDWLPLLRGDDICRYSIEIEKPEWIKYGPWLAAPREYAIFSSPRILIQSLRNPAIKDRLIATFTDDVFITRINVYSLLSKKTNLSLFYALALINSRLLNWSLVRLYGLHTYVITGLEQLPFRNISFSTPHAEREQLMSKAKRRYEQYLQSGRWNAVLQFVGERLPQKSDGSLDREHDQSDVVHDLLAFLAEEMTKLHREKQSKIKQFLSWLEEEIVKGTVEDQRNKTKIRGFHNGTLEGLLEVLKKNSVIPDPCPSSIRDTIADEFAAAVDVIDPLKARIKATDDLIDQIVYRLYRLSSAEIAVVEGKPSYSMPPQGSSTSKG